ncbi:MAG: lysophospholipid acyltransferase family protein [Pseudomonadota bacterium]
MTGGMIHWLRGFIFTLNIYPMMLVMGIVFLPYALLTPKGAVLACRTYARYVMFSARWMLGITTEIRGTPPTEEVLIASKHQSFLDIIMIFNAVPQPKFIMKRELLYTPVIGQYAYRLGCVPVRRGRRAEAIKQMVQDVKAGRSTPGQLCIYPQGTRIRPGVVAPYKIGTYALYRELEQPCVLAATNAGLFWPRSGMAKSPGHAVVEFLDPIPPHVPQEVFMADMETRIEAASNALMEEAGFKP